MRAGAGEQVHDHLGVARGLEYGAVVLERRTQRRGVGYSAVLGKADSAFAVSGRYGLDILPEIAAEIVAHVSDADLPFHAGEHVAAEHVVDKSVVLVRGQLVVVVGDYAAADVSAVLDGEKPVADIFCHISARAVEYADHAAFVPDFIR